MTTRRALAAAAAALVAALTLREAVACDPATATLAPSMLATHTAQPVLARARDDQPIGERLAPDRDLRARLTQHLGPADRQDLRRHVWEGRVRDVHADLVAEVGASQVLYGTDVPFNWPVTVDLVLNAAYLSDADKGAILGGNAAKLLRITA